MTADPWARRDQFEQSTIEQAVAETSGDPIPVNAPRWVSLDDMPTGHIVPGMTEERRRDPDLAMVALCGIGPTVHWQHGWAWEGCRGYRVCRACTDLVAR